MRFSIHAFDASSTWILCTIYSMRALFAVSDSVQTVDMLPPVATGPRKYSRFQPEAKLPNCRMTPSIKMGTCTFVASVSVQTESIWQLAQRISRSECVTYPFRYSLCWIVKLTQRKRFGTFNHAQSGIHLQDMSRTYTHSTLPVMASILHQAVVIEQCAFGISTLLRKSWTLASKMVSLQWLSHPLVNMLQPDLLTKVCEFGILEMVIWLSVWMGPTVIRIVSTLSHLHPTDDLLSVEASTSLLKCGSWVIGNRWYQALRHREVPSA